MAGGDDLLAHRHGDRVGSPDPKRADLRRRLEARAFQAQVHALLHGNALRIGDLARERAELGVVAVQHREEPRRDGVGLGAHDRVAACKVDVVGHKAQIADVVALVDGAGGIAGDERVHADAPHEPDRERDLLRGVALVAMQAALHADDLPAAEDADDEAPDMPGDGRAFHMRHLPIGDEEGVLDAIGDGPQSRTEGDADFRFPVTQARAQIVACLVEVRDEVVDGNVGVVVGHSRKPPFRSSIARTACAVGRIGIRSCPACIVAASEAFGERKVRTIAPHASGFPPRSPFLPCGAHSMRLL